MKKIITSHQSRNYPRSQSQRKKSRNRANFKAINKEVESPKSNKKGILKVPWGSVKVAKSQINKLKASTPKGNIKHKTDFNNEIKKKGQKTVVKKALKRSVNSLKNLTERVTKPEQLEEKDIAQSFICKNIVPLDLSIIIDTSLEDSSSNEENGLGELRSSTNDSESISTSVGGSLDFSETGQGLIKQKENKNYCSVVNFKSEVHSRRQETAKHGLIKSKIERDSNARKHFVKKHLNELYTKILFEVKARQKYRR